MFSKDRVDDQFQHVVAVMRFTGYHLLQNTYFPISTHYTSKVVFAKVGSVEIGHPFYPKCVKDCL